MADAGDQVELVEGFSAGVVPYAWLAAS